MRPSKLFWKTSRCDASASHRCSTAGNACEMCCAYQRNLVTVLQVVIDERGLEAADLEYGVCAVTLQTPVLAVCLVGRRFGTCSNDVCSDLIGIHALHAARGADPQIGRPGHICHQQTGTQSANLAVIAHQVKLSLGHW